MESTLSGFICPKCKTTKNRATLMKEIEGKKLWIATCLSCGAQGSVVEEIKNIKKTNSGIITL